MDKLNKKGICKVALVAASVGIIICISLICIYYNWKLYSYELEMEDLQKKYQTAEETIKVYQNRIEIDKVFLTPLMDDDWELSRYESPEEKKNEYDWFAGIYTEFGYCGNNSKLLDILRSYENPIDMAYMIYLNDRGVSCEAARRDFQYSYAGAWRDEFYNVAQLLYGSLTFEEDKERFVTFVKSIEHIIECYRDEILLFIIEDTGVSPAEREIGAAYGIGTNGWLAEEAGDIYRMFALKLIDHYQFGVNDEYKYLTNQIEMREGIATKIPKDFQ